MCGNTHKCVGVLPAVANRSRKLVVNSYTCHKAASADWQAGCYSAQRFAWLLAIFQLTCYSGCDLKFFWNKNECEKQFSKCWVKLSWSFEIEKLHSSCLLHINIESINFNLRYQCRKKFFFLQNKNKKRKKKIFFFQI